MNHIQNHTYYRYSYCYVPVCKSLVDTKIHVKFIIDGFENIVVMHYIKS